MQVLTASPDIEGENLASLRIEIPRQYEAEGFECFQILIAAMFGESAVLQQG
jgi:hypothetical protein